MVEGFFAHTPENTVIPILRGAKVGPKLEKLSFFQEIRANCSNFASSRFSSATPRVLKLGDF